MRPVGRAEILDYVTYGERRDEIRREIFVQKQRRRVHMGAYLTFLFENRDTVRYQIHEIMRVEQIVKEADIEHELSTYNELLGRAGELGCCLLIEIDDAAVRPKLLSAWRDLPQHLYARLADGRKVRAMFDERQRDERRLSAVQFLRFPVDGESPLALGSDLPELCLEAALSDEQRLALADDLAEE